MLQKMDSLNSTSVEENEELDAKIAVLQQRVRAKMTLQQRARFIVVATKSTRSSEEEKIGKVQLQQRQNSAINRILAQFKFKVCWKFIRRWANAVSTMVASPTPNIMTAMSSLSYDYFGRIYKYYIIDRYGLEIPIYVGKTKQLLKKRDNEHRNANKTYFDQMYKPGQKNTSAKIKLLIEKSFTTEEEQKNWMNIFEFIYMHELKTYNSSKYFSNKSPTKFVHDDHDPLGCNEQEASNYRETIHIYERLKKEKDKLKGKIIDKLNCLKTSLINNDFPWTEEETKVIDKKLNFLQEPNKISMITLITLLDQNQIEYLNTSTNVQTRMDKPSGSVQSQSELIDIMIDEKVMEIQSKPIDIEVDSYYNNGRLTIKSEVDKIIAIFERSLESQKESVKLAFKMNEYCDMEVREDWGVTINKARFDISSSFVTRFPCFVNDVCNEHPSEYHNFTRVVNGEDKVFEIYHVNDLVLFYKYILHTKLDDIISRNANGKDQDCFLLQLYISLKQYTQLVKKNTETYKIIKQRANITSTLFNIPRDVMSIKGYKITDLEDNLFRGFMDKRLEVRTVYEDSDDVGGKDKTRKQFSFLDVFQCGQSQREILEIVPKFEMWLETGKAKKINGEAYTPKTRANIIRAIKIIWSLPVFSFYDPFEEKLVYALRGLSDLIAEPLNATPRPVGKWQVYQIGSYLARVKAIVEPKDKHGFKAVAIAFKQYVEDNNIQLKKYRGFKWRGHI